VGCADVTASSARAPRRQPASISVPEWVMRAKAQPVNPQLPLAVARERVVRELATAELSEAHLPAEQLANAALQSLQAGRAMDAALWMSLGSYRYGQEWNRILRSPYGNPKGDGNVPALFYKLRDLELAAYGDLSFTPHLRALAKILRAEDAVDWDFRRRLAELFREGPVDEETFAELLRQKASGRGGGAGEILEATDVADAYLRHLRTAVAEKRYRTWAVRALADTPLATFSLEALRGGLGKFSPRLCSTLANQLSSHADDVRPFLSDGSAVARANAVVVLGMNPVAEQLPSLEKLRQSEKDTSVRLALSYALARHGQDARVADLVEALSPCPSDVCDEAAMLLDWLPDGLLARVEDQEILVRLAGDFHQTFTVRSFAAVTLGRIGAKRSLSLRAREVLTAMGEEKNPDLSARAAAAVASDAGFSRERVLAGLQGPSPPYRALLARLSRVATVGDLPLLAQIMPRFAGKPGPDVTALIDAAARVPEAAAETQLMAWFDAHPSLRRHIAFRTLGRPKLDGQTWQRLDGAADRNVHLLVRLAARAPDALALLKEGLRAVDPNIRLFAAVLAGTVRDPRTKEDLWSLVNFRDDHLYPDDERLRYAGMSALLWIAITELAAARRPPNVPPPVLTEGPA
jgi:hypothetical protein